ncbi:MAG TPA: acyl-CoA dehydrogenase family protein [Dehalococcoidia bacterium]|nr:acyl-CoA dehydrogenase family protein [Dehalococcoidia bacterium]
MTATAAPDLLAAARALAPLIRAHADETERERCLARPVVEALRAAGLYSMYAPRSLGGPEVAIATAARVVEEAARADGATGWNVMLTGDAGVLSGFAATAEARAAFAGKPTPILAGSINALGSLSRVHGGYRVSGRWPFGSGCQQADWFVGGGVLCDETGPDGEPQRRQALIPAVEVQIVDTWRTAGLRGTGSHDWTVQDLFVPEGRVMNLNPEAPYEPGPLYAFPFFATLAVAKAAVALGIARHAIDTLVELAQAKTPAGQTNLLRERAAVQADVARAEALLRSSRTMLYQTIDEVWADVAAGRKATLEQRALLRLAAADGAHKAAQAVDLMYNAGGASSIYESSPLERCFRDVHVVTAHMMVQQPVYEVAGRALLGLPPGTRIF